MRILVTRPEPDASALAAILAERGHEPIVSPLSVVELLPPTLDVVSTETAAGLIVTSKNAMRALARYPLPDRVRALPIFCVGPETSGRARDAGFRRVIEGPGTAVELVPIIEEHLQPEAGPVLRLTGDMPSNAPLRISENLRKHRYNVEDIVCYRTRAQPRLTQEAEIALREGRADCVILMSPQAAKNYVKALTFVNLTNQSDTPVYVCLSSAVADVLFGIPQACKFVADKPNQTGLLSVVDQVVAELS